MKQRPRRYFTAPEMALIWDRWEKGESLNAIARDLGRYHSAVRGAVARTGGILTLFIQARGALKKELIKQAHKLPRELYKSLTWDRGKEVADHQRFSLDTGIKVYFCDPQSPWQCGSNENTNGLLRQYFPKGMDLSNIHQNRLNAVARRLNERPRKTL